MSEEKKYYVYVHRYASGPKEGQVFYVGKGSGDRMYLIKSRSEWWLRVYEKYGRNIDVISQNMTECCALTLEKIVIGSMRRSGVDLVNITDGGEGISGMEHPSRVKVFSSLGEEFPSIMHAVDYLKMNGFNKASVSAVARCCSGEKKTAYGRSWSSRGAPEHPDVVGTKVRAVWPKENQSKPVETLCGKKFPSINAAVRFLRGNGFPKASKQPITLSCDSDKRVSYGYRWRFSDAK